MLTKKNNKKQDKAKDVKVIDCGKLSDTKWLGTVSATDMIAAGFTTQVKIDEAAAAVNAYYVPNHPDASTRCIDGRDDPNVDETRLGPQVPGGAPGAALAYRLGVDKDDLTRGTFVDDAEVMIANFVRLGVNPGGHRDENAGNIKVGCGAIDGMDKILAAMTNITLIEDQKRLLKLLLAEDFNRDNFLRDLGASTVVNARAKEYFRDRQQVIDYLETRFKDSVATLSGEHKECLVIVNTVPNTTFASTRFSRDFGGMQAFGYDIWRSKELAQKLLPLPSQDQDRQRFITARVMYTIATLMALTDGSQRLLIRVPA